MRSHQEEEWHRLRSLHAERSRAIKQRLQEFASVHPSEYFYELTYCLLTPQSSAVNAENVVRKLQAANFHIRWENPEAILRSSDHYIRFHRTKSKHLLALRERFPAVAAMLQEPIPTPERREWLVRHVKGLGWKEATHFLRNIGKNEGLAILDRHILRNLLRCGVIRAIPTPLTKKQYLRIEKRFNQFAKRIGIPLDELDLLFWSLETGVILK